MYYHGLIPPPLNCTKRDLNNQTLQLFEQVFEKRKKSYLFLTFWILMLLLIYPFNSNITQSESNRQVAPITLIFQSTKVDSG